MSTGVLPRITYHSAQDPEILLQLEANDAEIGGLAVRFDDMDDAYRGNWAKRVGNAIGKSTHLRKLGISGAYYSRAEEAPPAAPFGLPSLFMGIAENRTIEELSLYEFNHAHMNTFTTLDPFFEHNSKLRCLRVTNSTNMKVKFIGSSIVSALTLTSNLEQIDISDNHLGDKKTADIIDGLTKLRHLVELNLGRNEIRKKGCKALRKLLRIPKTNLRKLFLNNNDIDDTCVDILYGGLVANNSLQFLNLQHQKHITSSGWSVFFDVLSNSVCSLDMILVCGNTLGDDGAISLGKSLPGNTRLSVMHLRDCRNVSSVGWQGFSRGLSYSNSSIISLRKLLRIPKTNLRKLFLNNNDIDDTCVDILYGGLVANNSLQFLNLQHQKHITSSGWSVFFDVLSNSVCSLDMILVCGNTLGDDGAISLGKSLPGNTRLSVMHLRDCRNVSSVGWQGFSRGLSYSNSSIISLDLSNCNIDDYGALGIASALATNTVLQRLKMECIGVITSAGWREFFRQLTMCVSPSLQTLSFSNNKIDDGGIALLAIALPKMSKLTTFNMTYISANRWGYFVDILKPSSALKLRELSLGTRNPGLESQRAVGFQRAAIDDDIIFSFADALVGNTTLVIFSLLGYNFSERSWTELENVFCNKSTIDETFCSNHTLYSFDFSQRRLCLESLLAMNYNKDKYGVARKKILLHQLGEFDSILDVVGPMSTPVLPFALSWLGKDRCEYSMMFQLLQSMPWLMGSAIKSDNQVRK